MKIGDIFKSNGVDYKVIGYDSQGRCVSTCKFEPTEDVKTEEQEPTPEQTTEEQEKYTASKIERMSKVNLEKLCSDLGIAVKETAKEMRQSIIEKLGL